LKDLGYKSEEDYDGWRGDDKKIKNNIGVCQGDNKKRKRNDKDNEESRKKNRQESDDDDDDGDSQKESDSDNENDESGKESDNEDDEFDRDEYKKRALIVVKELFLPRCMAPRKSYIPVPPEYPMDCLARIGLAGLQWIAIQKEEGMWSPGQVLDISQTVEKLFPILEKRIVNMERWNKLRSFMEKSAIGGLFVKFS